MTLVLTFGIVLATMIGAMLYGHQKSKAKTVSEWAVGGRSFGTLIFWFLNAGEIYTTFAVLGISGYAWAYGAPAYLAFTSVSLAATLGYWLMPRIWQAGRQGGFITQADFFAARYKATWLGCLVGLAGIAAIVVYVQIQITALSLILRLTLGTEVSGTAAAIIAAGIMLAFVYVAGLRSAAFAAGVKDVLMIVLVVGLSATVAGKVGASSILDVFARVQDQHPGIGVFPGMVPEAGLTVTWMMTAALNVALGTWIFRTCSSSATRPAAVRPSAAMPCCSRSIPCLSSSSSCWASALCWPGFLRRAETSTPPCCSSCQTPIRRG